MNKNFFNSPIINNTIYFDMDGTIANLYMVENWLEKLRAFDPSPYEEAEPIGDLLEICELLMNWKLYGGKIGIISWCAGESNSEYDKAVRRAKKNWLKEHMPINFDEIHIVKYGTSKKSVAKDKNGFLIDDNEEIRVIWGEENSFNALEGVEKIVKNILREKGIII